MTVLKTEQKVKPLMRAFEAFEKQYEQLSESHAVLKGEMREINHKLKTSNNMLNERLEENSSMKRRVTSILNAITEAVFLIDDSFNCECANLAAEQLKDENPDILLNPYVVSWLYSDDDIRNRNLIVDTDSGEHVFIVTVIRSDEEDFVKILCFKDITDEHELQKRIEREDRLRSLGHIAANVAHEIRNPLHAIDGFVHFLHKDIKADYSELESSDRILTMTERIRQATNQLNNVVSNLLSFTRDMKCECRTENLNEIVLDVYSTFELTHDSSSDVSFSFENPSNGPLYASLDTVLIKQVFANILSNAFESCQERMDAEIKISTGGNEEHVWVEFSDTGCGIPDDLMQRIFDPFYTSKAGGIGLGLAMCRRIVDAHNGRLHVKSIEEKGSVFQLIFNKIERL
ncbi:MAG: GHKL domain-containing protein [Lentisphaeria bacterium]|nr:ATP-binding protein [Lentisphaeria bacterium]NQZ69142.1 GHKL domain-containing protein [Lentisphaeria bacterium]